MSDTYISLRPPSGVPLLERISHPHITLVYINNRSPREVAAALPHTWGCGPLKLGLTGTGTWVGQVEDRPPYWINYYSVATVDKANPRLRSLRSALVQRLFNKNIRVNEDYDFSPHITRLISSNVMQINSEPSVLVDPPVFTVDQLYISAPGDHDNVHTITL